MRWSGLFEATAGQRPSFSLSVLEDAIRCFLGEGEAMCHVTWQVEDAASRDVTRRLISCDLVILCEVEGGCRSVGRSGVSAAVQRGTARAAPGVLQTCCSSVCVS